MVLCCPGRCAGADGARLLAMVSCDLLAGGGGVRELVVDFACPEGDDGSG